MKTTILAVVLALFATGCRTTTTMYRWGNYDEKLYAYYKHPAEREVFVTELQRIVAEAEQGGGKVPPGCYAELGYALYEQGQLDDAAAYFRKERDSWPESRALMTAMLGNVERRGARNKPDVVPASQEIPSAAPVGGGR